MHAPPGSWSGTLPPWPVEPADDGAVGALSERLRLHPLVARVLVARGFVEAQRAEAHVRPRLADLTRPDAMLGREAAAERILAAIDGRERIAVFGDYDVDGATSAALLGTVLRRLGGDVVLMNASRFEGGYGLSQPAAQRVRDSGASLVISCDCGTSDHERLAWLAGHGVDAIVVDHHKVPDEPLPARAFLNPHQPGCGFEYKHLASVGLCFSLAAALRARRAPSLDLREYLDLVALGTVADVAPLSGDNRILTHAGLVRIAAGQARPGIRALVRTAGLRARLRAFDLGFSLGPLLNAPGRLGSPEPTMRLLLADDDAAAAAAADELQGHNTRRREISQLLLASALGQVEGVYGRGDLPAGLVVGGDGWHPGVGGIVAGRLTERFGRPVIVVALHGAEGVGSARAPRGFPLFRAVQACAEHLIRFGGHDGAAGLGVLASRLEALRTAFAAACDRVAHEGPAPGRPTVEAELRERDLTPDLAAALDMLEPTGSGHGEARVGVRDVRLSDLRPVGTTHLRARMLVGTRRIGVFIRDGLSRRERGQLSLRESLPCHVTGLLRRDAFAGMDAVQLELESVAAAS